MLEFDEFASVAPAWYKEIVEAACQAREEKAQQLARAAVTTAREVPSCLAAGVVRFRRLDHNLRLNYQVGDALCAKPFVEEALEYAKQHGDEIGEAAALHNLAKILACLGARSQAIVAAESALALYVKMGNHVGEASVLNTKAFMRIPSRSQSEMLENARKSLALFKNSADGRGEIAALSTIHQISLDAGDSQNAREAADEIVRVCSAAAGHAADGAAGKELIAHALLAQGDLQEALTYAQQAVEIYNDLKLGERKAGAVILMATVLEADGQHGSARKSAEAALKLCQLVGSKRGQAAAHCKIASLLELQKDFSGAAHHLEMAVSIYRRHQNPFDEAQAMHSLACLQLKMYSEPEARAVPLRHLRKAVSLFQGLELGHSSECAYCLQTYATLLSTIGQKEHAVTIAMDSLSIFKKLGDFVGEEAAQAVLDQVCNSKADDDDSSQFSEATAKPSDVSDNFAGRRLLVQISTLGAGVVTELSISTIVSGAVLKDRLEGMLSIHKSEQNLTIGPLVWEDAWSLSEALNRAGIERAETTVQVTLVRVPGTKRVVLTGGRDGTLRLWDIKHDTAKRVLDPTTSASNIRAAMTCVAVNLPSQLALSGSEDGLLRLWNLNEGKVSREIQGHSDAVACLAADWKEQWAITGGGDHILRLWKLPHCKQERKLCGHRGTVTCVALDVVYFQAFSGGMDRALRLWDLSTGTALKECLGHMTPISCLAVSIPTQNAVSGGWATLKCWQLNVYRDGFNFKNLRGHTSAVTCVAVDWSARSVLTGSLDTTLCLYRREWGDTPKVLRRHTLPVNCLAWDIKRKTAVSGGGDGLWVWDMEQEEAVRRLQGHTGEILAVSLDQVDEEEQTQTDAD